MFLINSRSFFLALIVFYVKKQLTLFLGYCKILPSSFFFIYSFIVV